MTSVPRQLCFTQFGDGCKCGGGGKVGEDLQQIYEIVINPRHCISYSLRLILVCCCYSSMKEWAGHYHIVVTLVNLVQIGFYHLLLSKSYHGFCY